MPIELRAARIVKWCLGENFVVSWDTFEFSAWDLAGIETLCFWSRM